MHGLCQATLLCLPTFSFWRCSTALFCAMKLPSSDCSLNLLHSFLAPLLFVSLNVPSFSIPVRDLPSFSPGELSATFSHVHSCPSFLVCSGSSTSAPNGIEDKTNTSCTRQDPRHVGQLFLPCHVLPHELFHHLSNLVLNSISTHVKPSHSTWVLLLPHLMQRSLLAAAHHSVRCFFASMFCPQRSTVLLVSACVHHNRANLPLGNERLPHPATSRTAPLFSAELCWP